MIICTCRWGMGF